MYCGVEFGGGGGGAGGECVDDKFQVLASAPDRGLHIPSSSSSSPLSAFGDHGILVFGVQNLKPETDLHAGPMKQMQPELHRKGKWI